MTDFVHLHVHTEFSLLDGAARIDTLVKKAKELEMKALAITDHGNMYGVIPFYLTCKKEGVKPIIGCEIYLTSSSRHEKGSRAENKIYHLVLLAETNKGYENLMEIVSIAHLEGFHYKPRVDKEVLRKYSEGIIALSGCLSGEINSHLLQGNYQEAKRVALEYKSIFKEDNFYLEIQDHQIPEQKTLLPLIKQLSDETNIKLVATNDVHYIEQHDAIIQDVLISIGTGSNLEDEGRLKFPTKEFYLKNKQMMIDLFIGKEEAIQNTLEIAERCHVEIDLQQNALPKFPLPSGIKAEEYLRALAKKGLEKRYQRLNDTLVERLNYELSVIEKMGFADYFLIVWDFMKYSHQHDIITGPGRGSAAGSLVAYSLGITNVDPIKYGLLFERFLNPERISMPDIDIDFSYERREEVISYVSEKYGPNHVAQIITFGTFAARASIRDVGRVLNMAYGQVDKIAKMIPSQLGITIKQALEETNELKKLYQENKEIRKLLDISMKIEGMPRHHSTHAAGVVISDKPLTRYTPLQIGQADISLSQYPMGILEKLGLLKMDFLGLRNLTIIEKTLYWIKKTRGLSLNLQELDDHDIQTYQLLSKGTTKGVFQLESAGITKVLKELKPTHFEDIIAVLALYRPGPMEFIPDYIQAKHGQKKVTYPHQSLEAILKDTYGIIVYQEQIMQIASKMAGFSLGEADLLRRAVSKKKRDILVQEREHFVNGALKSGYSEETANAVYDMIVRFADYGFNRSHAVAYGVLAFQTAYLKTHYTVEFMAALLSESMGNTDKVVEYLDECKRLGMKVLPPSVIDSHYSFTIEGNDKIRFGLAAIKNIGTQVIEAILKVREKQTGIESIMDFCMKVDNKLCNRKTMEALIYSGALDSFGIHRKKLLVNLEDLLDRVNKKKKLEEDLQIHLFDDLDSDFTGHFDWIEIEPFSKKELLQKEKEVLGLYLSGNPLEMYQDILNRYVTHQYGEISHMGDGTKIVIGGLINEIKPILTKKGQQMAFVLLEVQANEIELIFFPKAYQRYQLQLEKDDGILVQGKLDKQEDKVKIIVDKMTVLSKLKASSKGETANEENETYMEDRIMIRIPNGHGKGKKLNQLKRVLQEAHGNIPVILYYEENKKTIKLSEDYWVTYSEDIVMQVENILGKNSIAKQ